MKNRIALKITLIYFIIGFLWILFSDRFILSIEGSGNAITILQTYKGWFFVSVTAIILFFLILNEIKKKNEIESDLRKAKLKAEESDTLKSAFLSNLSHEIRTPLNGILGFCELLTDDEFGKEDKKIFAENLTKNGTDLLKLMNDIMDISRIQGNQLNISPKKFNLNNLLQVIYFEYEQSDYKIMRKNVDFKLIMGSQNDEIVIESDPVRLTHVFKNLLNNAFNFTKDGFIGFGYIKKNGGIELFVEDSGCGIDESAKSQIFKPFFKGKNQAIGNKGFGLGLAISKGLVKLLGSDLQYISTSGKGTRFYFTLDKQFVTAKRLTAKADSN
ncbi:MAG: HAMP domain-containing sensor histidine kinase [Prolixibacteraceae bacterium]|jgi:signal transduction histidine kinase